MLRAGLKAAERSIEAGRRKDIVSSVLSKELARLWYCRKKPLEVGLW
jgi:hypothetical protein